MVPRRRRPAEAQCIHSLGLGYKTCAVIPVAGQRTHETTYRALIVTSQVATPGAESAVYDCLVLLCKPSVIFVQCFILEDRVSHCTPSFCLYALSVCPFIPLLWSPKWNVAEKKLFFIIVIHHADSQQTENFLRRFRVFGVNCIAL